MGGGRQGQWAAGRVGVEAIKMKDDLGRQKRRHQGITTMKIIVVAHYK